MGDPLMDKSKSELDLLQKDFSTFLANMVQQANIHKNMAAESIAARRGFGGQALVQRQEGFARLGISQQNPADQAQMLRKLTNTAPNFDPNHTIIRD